MRSFAHALGELTGTGACLEALRRIRSGEFGLDVALPIRCPRGSGARPRGLIPLDRVLRGFPSVTITDRGRGYVSHGRELGPDEVTRAARSAEWTRLVDGAGTLVALATPGKRPVHCIPLSC